MRMIVVDSKDEAMKHCACGMGIFEVTKKQVKELLKGKIIVDADPDEYGTMIVLVEEE